MKPGNSPTHLKPPRLRRFSKLRRDQTFNDGPVGGGIYLSQRILAHLEGRDLARQPRPGIPQSLGLEDVERAVLDELSIPVLAPRPLDGIIVLRYCLAIFHGPEEAVRAHDGN